MADPVDRLFQEWQQLGGQVLLAEIHTVPLLRAPEQVIAESTTHCRASGRLTWVTLDWLIRHIEQLDEDRLLRETQVRGNFSVLGLLCDAANMRRPHPKFQRIICACKPTDTVEPFFQRVAKSRTALALTQQNALEVFRRWNYLCSELRYL